MKYQKARGEEIRQFIIANIEANPSDIAKITMERFGITRQAVNKHLSNLIEQGIVEYAGGETKNREYKLKVHQHDFKFQLSRNMSEDDVWREHVLPLIQNLPSNVIEIWNYGFTEMVNNAIDHSGGKVLRISVFQSVNSTNILVIDDGEGIFNKIQRHLGLSDPRQSLLHLATGKFTTDPERHSGEGIFFTSRAFDVFAILSDNLSYMHQENKEMDYLEDGESIKGTTVCLTLSNTSARKMIEVFDLYMNTNFDFSKTIVPVNLAFNNDGLISRSQAKRLLSRIDRFKIVLLDFKDVKTIGQGFADEIFRVFTNQHPDIEIFAINTNEDVSKMISHAILSRKD